ncbi:SET domain-containing protein [Burkholderia sp. MBR-1]|uniref:SET domain-containing protein n=1 Tax=Burkholderia sp. MBR-1 TaxID=2732364 RepID=UPI0015EE6C49|nr:SET domain-containing protein-lysine N-methyltransferase [Burkholderia sp. MBR-1]QMI49975.1 SET domain-containing protein-lysine N-methyltransferase [Burkholderia sp. MBR-1]
MRRRISVRRSSVHGKGVFALESLHAGERILEYRGERISWAKAVRRYARSGDNAHTFLFGLDDGDVIDGGIGGNSARWLNHACSPNCRAEEVDGRVHIFANIDIPAGSELFIDYQLAVDHRVTNAVRRRYGCACRASQCRGTMLAVANR